MFLRASRTLLFVAIQPYLVVFGQDITNVKASIEDKALIVTYDLNVGDPNAECEIQLFFGNSNSQDQLLTNGSGDIGIGIKGGNNKSIKIEDLRVLKPYQQDLSFRVNATYSYIPITGTISIVTEPKGIRVYLNEKYLGESDQVLTYQNIGDYSVRLEKEGYLTIEKEISVTKNETSAISENMIPGYASTITSNPSGVSVLINNKEAGITPADVVLDVGENTIELVAKYYNPQVEKITPSSQGNTYDFELKKKQYQIEIDAYPEDVNINFDHQDYSAKDIINTTAGKKDLTIVKSGYKSYEGSLDIDDFQNLKQYQFLLEPVKFRKKSSAIIRSILLPGFGQRYLKRRGVEPLLSFVGYGLVVGSILQHNQAVSSYDSYLATSDAVERADLKNDWMNQKKQSDNLLYVAAGVWVLNIIWTVISPDEISRYNRIKSELNFDNVTSSGGISIKYQIGK